MPVTINKYACQFCKRRYDDFNEAEVCEDRCLQFKACTVCCAPTSPHDLTYAVDAAGFEHRLCLECMDDIHAIGGEPGNGLS